MIHAGVCAECKEWHSHYYPHPKFVCIDCYHKLKRKKMVYGKRFR